MNSSSIRIHYSNKRITRILTTLITAAIKAADPQEALRGTLIRKGHQIKAGDITYDLSRFRRVLCVGAGKGSGRMAMALEQVLGDALEGGIVIVTDGHNTPCNHIRILEAAHPVPDRRSVKATQGILSLVQSLTPHDLLIVLLSGGASSLLCAPAAGLTLADKQRTTRLLLRSGAAIHDMNVVRKHMSAIKGGQLAQATPATILTFIISDVLGDDLATIGSGPTVPDSSTFQDAIDILKQYKIWSKVPMAVQRHLKKGLASTVPDILKPPRQRTSRNRHIVLANNSHAIKGLAKAARQLKLKPFIMPFPFQGEAKEVGNILGSLGRDLVEFDNPARPPACLIAGGEPTVTIKGNGKGGRVQECMVAAAQELAGLHNIFVAGFGTDGTDGPTDAAGAIVDGTTAERASKKGLDISRVLNNHDSYNFFKHVGGHIITGPTGTNVNDIYFIFAL